MLFKKKNKVVWRDKNGNIRCQGDNCPVECDNSCPIWINTIGAQLMQRDEYEKAANLYKAGLELAPDMPDLWNNLAACCGALGNYQGAYDSYKKAYELAGRKNALCGLALSARDCGKSGEALAYCIEYRGKFRDGALDEVERELKDKNEKKTESSMYMDMLIDFLKIGTEQGYVNYSDTIPFIPELSGQADNVCDKIFRELSAFIDKDTELNYSSSKKLETIAMWSAFAGMGAVCFWNEDWNDLQKTGIVEKLSSPEGIDCMDDVVLDAVGIGRVGEESDKLRKFFLAISVIAAKRMPKEAQTDPKVAINAMMERNKAMYMFGIAVEMHRLGMN